MTAPAPTDIAGIVSLIASIASLVLALLAIWLAFKFYELSKESADRAERASNEVNAAVDRLQKIFEMQYSDTFSMVRDTYTDFRRHLLADSEASDRSDRLSETKASAKAQSLKDEAADQVAQILEASSSDPAPPAKAEQQLKEVVSRAIDRSLAVNREARDEAVKDRIVEYLQATNGPGVRWRIGAVVGRFRDEFPLNAIVKTLYDLHVSRTIELNGDFANWVELGPETTFIAVHLDNASLDHMPRKTTRG